MADKDSKEDKVTFFDWVFYDWLNQFLFFLVCTTLCYLNYKAGVNRLEMWYYLGFSSVLLGFGTINLLLNGAIRYFIALFVIIINTYLIPFSIYAYGCQMSSSAGFGLGYLIISIILSPIPISVAILASGVTFAFYQKYYYFDLKQTSTKDMILMISYYIAAGVLGFCWKILITKMYEFMNLAIKSSAGEQQKENEQLKANLENIYAEQQQLKEEVAMHIIEMNQITAKK